jgi:uncharacterized repeat protein (TIGR01451 family)
MKNQIVSSRHRLQWLFFSFLFLLFVSVQINAQITGTVFRDYNGDGIRQSGEPLRGDIIVKFYTNGTLPVKDVLVGTTSTASDGTYSFNPPSYPVRIEFEIPDGFCNLSPVQDFSAGNGNTYGTAVQFADGPGIHNFIITYPADFALTDNPPTYTTCFVNGDPLVPGTSGSSDAFVGMNYLDNGHGANSGYYPSNPNGGPMGPPHTILGTAAQVGTVWGVAISKQARKIFTSSFLKRHAGLGPLGGGGIYMIDPDDYSTSYNYNWLDFDSDLNIPTSNEAGVYTNALIASNQVQFSPVIGTNSQRGLTGNKLDPSQDAAAWEQVGKVSFGDLDISEDGRWLYVVNLYDRKLYQLDLVDPFNPVAPVLADVGTKVKGFTIPDPCSGNAGEHMPFAVKVTRGKVFVGLVCNGQALNGTTVGTADDLMGYIYEFDVATETFNPTPVLSFPLNYRGATANPWLPWTNQFQSYFEGPGFPMITDIEFDGKGNMIIGMVDRRGHQAGWYNYDLNGTGSYAIAVVGDLLQGLRDPNSSTCQYSIQFTPEFYKDDKFHPEPVNGGLATHRTSTVDNTIVTYMDPVWIWSGGTMRFDNLTGNQIGDGYEIYFNPDGGNAGTFGKAAGIGDIETLGEVPLLEIGNVVWSDVDRDGIQDPDEPVLSGVIVELVNDNGTVVGTSTTDSDGGYYFNYTNTNDPDGNGTLGPQPYTNYTIRISSTQYNNFGVNGSPLEGFVLTLTNESGVGLSDYSDNDAVLVGGIAEIAITTAGPAENNHTFDFGFYPTTFDVALAKTTSLTLPVAIGQDVPFTITVTNQGTDIVNSINVTDYIPAGYIFNAADNPNWTGSFPTVNYTASVANGLLPAPGIAVGASFDITLILEVAATANANNINNFAEVTGGTDVVGNDATDDIDSTPDNNPANDAGGQIRSDADDYINGDGTGTPGDGIAATDEDDHDGATVRFIDVALVKDISPASPPPYSYGSPVTYVITVSNQSNESVYNIEIEDDLPSGFSFSSNNGWVESSPGILTNTIAGPIAPGGNSSVELILTPIRSNQPNAWVNQAQVTGFDDENGDPIGDRDIDSDPGNGPSGGTEDDDDNEVIEIFDLALQKRLVTTPPYSYGQTHIFEIEVFNQGNVPATNIIVKDYIPAGYSYVTNNGWTGAYPNIQNTIAGPIAPGASAVLTLELTLQPTGSGDFTNYAEIAAGNGPSGPGFDADSNPDSNSSEEQDVEPGDPDDDNINGGGPNVGEDEDDHDPAGPSIFDLALRKIVDTALPSYSYGQDVMYTITVFNQGNIPAGDIVVRDTIPCGFEFDPSDPANIGWTQSGQVITNTISSVLNPGQFTQVMVNYIVRPCYTDPATAWTNYAEISAALNNETGLPGDDIDSDPDNNMNNDNGGVPDFNGVMSGTDNTINNENGDEDDHDPHQIQVFDLALRKVLTTAGPYSYGQLLTFTIDVFNQGNVTAQNIVISDYLPAGYSFVTNNGWTSAGPGLLQNTIAGPLAPGAFTTLTLQLTLETGANQTSWNNYAEVSASQDDQGNNRNDDADSVTDTNPNNDNPVAPGDPNDDVITGLGPNVGEDQDDHDPAAPVVVDIALNKTVTTAGPYSYGQTVNYDITLTNQGNIPLTNIVIKDELPCGMTYSGGSQPWTVAGNEASTTYPGLLQPFTSATITINVTLNECYTNPGTAWTNIAQVVSMEDEDGDNVSDDDVDSDPDNDDPSEDDQDDETLQIFDLALTKVIITPAPYTYGQLLTFDITVSNQGNTTAQNIVISDYLPQGYSFVANNGWTNAGPGLLQNTVAGPLEPGTSTTLTLELTLETGVSQTSWDNYAEVTSAEDNGGNDVDHDADSNPDSDPNNDNPVTPGDPDDDNVTGGGPNAGEDEDDHDPAGVNIIDIALNKTVTTAGPYSYGQTVSYDITLTNQGNVPLTNIVVKDELPCGMTYSGGSQPWTVVGNEASTTYTGLLQPFTSATITISVTLNECYTNPASAWTNIAQVVSMEDEDGDDVSDDDIDSDPDNDDPTEDDQDDETLVIHDVAITKTAPTGSFNVGDNVTFVISVYNQGNYPLDSVQITDYIPSGFTFVPNNNWVSAGSNAVLTATSGNGLLPLSGLQPGSFVEYPIVLTIAVGANINNVVNLSEISGSSDTTDPDQGEDADSTPDNDPDNDNDVTPGDPDDDTITGGGPDENEDEDDSDPATIELINYSIGNQVWLDANNNGIIDGTESGIQNVIVDLYYFNPNTMNYVLIQSTTTDANGLYLFDTLNQGNYLVALNANNFTTGQPFSNYISSTGSGPLNLSTGTYEDIANQINTGNSVDSDDNGVLNGQGFLPGAIVSNVVTLGDGEPVNENPDNDTSGALDQNSDLTIDFGLVPMHSIGNQVWVDINNNGTYDSGEAPLQGVEVVLHFVDPVSGTCVVVDTLFTDINGYYLFDSLIAGQYIVEVTAGNFASGQPLEGFASSTGNGAIVGNDSLIDPENGTDGDDNGILNGNPMFVGSVVSDTLTLGNNEPLNEDPDNDTSGALDGNSNLTVDFGFIPLMSIGNQVWNDANNDGLINGAEVGIANVVVNLHFVDPVTGDCSIIATTITDMNGLYLFDSLIQGQYIVEIVAANFNAGGPLSGLSSSTGGRILDTTTGIYEDGSNPVDPDNGADSDDNGLLNGNPMFVGAVVSDTLNLVWNGSPLNENPDNDNSGATDENSDLTVDFGFYTMYSIGNQVWIDNNYNGIIDNGETGISGVTVELHQVDPITGNCILVTTTITGANGVYLFDSLLIGEYIVVIPGSQMMPGGPLEDYLSSTGTFNAGGPYETPGVGANTNIDNDDNGTFNTNPMFFFGVVSDTIRLGDAPEPTGENPNNDNSGALDQNSNLTIDFGFIPKVFDLALRKEKVSPAQVTAYGDVVEFDITIFNQGNLDAENVVITDYIPAGFTLHPSSTGWSMVGPNAEYTITSVIPANTSTVVKIYLEVQMTNQVGGYINFAEISEAMDTLGNSSNPAVFSPYGTLVDVDSTPDDTNGNDAGGEPEGPSDNAVAGNGSGPIGSGPASGDEDDHDPALVEIIDVALRKTVVTPGPYQYNQNITYNIEVFNQGNVDLYNIEVSDYIPAGLVFVQALNPNWTVNGTQIVRTIAGPLAEQSSTSVSVVLRTRAMVPGASATADSWTNGAEISYMEDENGDDITGDDVDSDGDADPNNDPTVDDEINGDPNDPNTPNDEDDDDIAFIEIFDLALRKTLVTTPPYSYNSTHTFTIEVFNQGNVPATNIIVNDFVPVGYGFAANNGWSSTGPGTIQNTIIGPVMPGGSATLTLQLTLLQSDGGERNWINYAEIASGNGPNGPGFDADSSPNSNGANENAVVPGGPGDDNIESTGDGDTGSQDDHDPAGPSIFDLALTKVATTAAPSFSYGQVVTYEIEIFNQGNVAAGSIQVSDYIPCGLVFEPGLPNNALWNLVAPNRAAMDMNIILAPGASTTVLLDLRVQECYTDPETAWTNYAEITLATDVTTGNQGQDIDSDPDATNGNDPGGEPDFNGVPSGTDNTINNENGDEDDHDPHQIQVFDLALQKVVDFRGPYMIGETATFRITVYNQGNVPAENIVINDYIRSGFTFPANPGWTMVTAPTPAADGLLQYTIGGPLFPGASQEIVLQLVIALDANPAEADWFNYAEINSSQDDQGNNRNDDADSSPNSDTPYENAVLPDGPWDNVIDGGGSLVNEDEDDHDPEKVIVVGGLGDTVWKDLNGNGVQDGGEPGVRNVIVRLQDCNGNNLRTTLTDASGFYFFDNLIPGNYNVKFDITGLAPGCQYTLPDQGSNDELDSDVNLQGLAPCTYITGGEYDSTFDAGILVLAALGDFVWHDLNGNGIQNVGEPGLPGVVVNLYRADGTLYGTTTTNSTGYYIFENLYPGDYYVGFVGPNGFELTLPNVGADISDSDVDGSNGAGTTATTTLVSGERDLTWDAGFYTCIPVGEVVWYDFNKNDIRDNFENGINGLEVNIFRRVGSVWQLFGTMYTGHKPGTPSDDGYWKFCVPPGTYYVNIDMPALGLVRVRPNIGGNPERDSDLTNANGPMTTGSFTVLSGQMKCDIGAGFYPMAVTGNTVWIDQNSNGIQDFNEYKVEGVVVEARNVYTNEIVRSAVTDHNGDYEMDYLESGAVYFKFNLPSEYNNFAPTAPNAGNDSEDSDVDGSFGPRTTRMFMMEPAMTNMDIDFGILQGVLPVDWLYVRAVKEDAQHTISWATAREVNTSHYIVERKRQGESDFVVLPGSVAAKGYSTKREDYVFADKDISQTGLYTYRVKQFDLDGKYMYSNEVTVTQQVENRIDLYPNPAKNSSNLTIELAEDRKVSVMILDDAGALVRKVMTSSILESGVHQIPVGLEGIPSGMYNVQIEMDGEQIQKKLVIID